MIFMLASVKTPRVQIRHGVFYVILHKVLLIP